MEGLRIKNLYNLEETIAADLFDGLDYPWQALPKIGEFILKLGPTLPKDAYDQIGEDVWIAKSATVFPSAYVHGPAIIGKELKNVVLFNKVQVPHYNYVGDSVLGYKAHMGAGSITSNVKADKTLVKVSAGSERIETGLKKFGAMLGDNVEVGCNAVLNPGTVIGRESNVYPTSMVRGFVPARSIFKNTGEVIQKKFV